jgi:hypothetical protein
MQGHPFLVLRNIVAVELTMKAVCSSNDPFPVDDRSAAILGLVVNERRNPWPFPRPGDWFSSNDALLSVFFNRTSVH